LTTKILQVIPARMANTKSAIKTNRRTKKQTLVNKSRKSKFKSAIKKINLMIEKKDKKKALEFLPKLNSQLMRVAKTGIVKKKKRVKKYF
tara:strand:- start:284 stop:553 length:270 start_codon:yes stop_codon:yes gene_type:complete